MKPIVIKDTNKEKINALIKEVEGRATTRIIDFDLIIGVCEGVTKTLDLSKKYLEGTEIIVDYHAQKMPRSYKYTPYSTWFSAKFYSGAWHLMGVYRDHLTESEHKAICVNLSDTAKEGLIKHFSLMDYSTRPCGTRYGFNF